MWKGLQNLTKSGDGSEAEVVGTKYIKQEKGLLVQVIKRHAE